AHLADPRGPARRDATALAGGPQSHGPDRPRGPGPAPLRRAEQRGDRPGPGPGEDGRQQPLHPRPEAAEASPDRSPRPVPWLSRAGRTPPGRCPMSTRGMTSDHGPVDRLAEEFLERHRRGERPAIAEYVARYPEWAAEIREVFPALVMMERLKPTPDDLTGSV